MRPRIRDSNDSPARHSDPSRLQPRENITASDVAFRFPHRHRVLPPRFTPSRSHPPTSQTYPHLVLRRIRCEPSTSYETREHVDVFCHWIYGWERLG